MFEIVNKQLLAPGVKRLDVKAERVAGKVRPGQFVSVCPEEGDESVPLTVVDWDRRQGTIALIFREATAATRRLGALSINDPVFTILGPLGVPTPITQKKTVICLATGVGVSQLLSVCRALKGSKNKVIGIIGARNKKELMLESQMRIACDKIYITTENGSYERRGLATDMFKELTKKHKVQQVYAAGSVEMMREACAWTKDRRIPTHVTLNPVMVDGMGLCGSCRVKVGGKTVLACVEGPGFDGHKVDFDHLQVRMNAYKEGHAWDNQGSPPSTRRTASKTFKRFLSDILND